MLELREKEKISTTVFNERNIKSSNNLQLESENKELMEQLKNTPQSTCSSNKEIFTDEFMAAQAFEFIGAGSDATAAMLSFVFYELATNQDLQKKVQDEISQVLSSNEFNFETVRKMTYMEQFIHETFRLHPLVGILVRMCTREYKIPGTEIVLEKGTTVNIPVSCLHKDPQYFPDPEKFNPDRFEIMEAVPKNVFFPFGGGLGYASLCGWRCWR